MAFRFEKSRSVAESVPKLVREQAKKATEGLSAKENVGEGVHVARTSSKRLRGLLRLLRPELGARFREEEKRLERIQKALGPLRDAQVLLETFDAHFGFTPESVPSATATKRQGGAKKNAKKSSVRKKAPGPLPEIRVALEARALSERLSGDVPDRIRAAHSEFRKIQKRAERFAPKKHGRREGGFRAIERGLEAIYRRGLKARDVAYQENSSHAFHEWRKAVKYHGHHLKLLAKIEPTEVGARLEDAEKLGDLLGKDHDLAVLAEALQTVKSKFTDSAVFEAALASISKQQQGLRKQAEPFGQRLYAESPAEFRRVMRRFFEAWRQTDGEAKGPEPQ